MALLISNGYVVTNDGSNTVLEQGDVLINGRRIVAVGNNLEAMAAECPGFERIDASRRIIMPGFVDAHMHSNEGFERGRYDNLPLEIWLSEVYPPFYTPKLTWRDHYLRALLIGILSLRSGVTTLQDDVINMSFSPEAVDATASAYRDLGLRGWITASMWDKGFCDSLPFSREVASQELIARLDEVPTPNANAQLDLFRSLYGKWHGTDNIQIILGPCGPQRCTRGLLEEVADMSRSLDLPVHCHVLETKTQAVTGAKHYGCTLVRLLADCGLLTHRLTMNHAIWLTPADIEMMGDAGCSITHNPLANLKLGSGVAPVRALLDAGVNVALGCDGVASADTADFFQAIKAAALVHKIGSFDYRTWVSAHEVQTMATTAGARSGLMGSDLGSIEAGKQADIILIDRDDWGFLPMHDPVRSIAFSANSDCVRTSIVAGRVVMRERQLTGINEFDIKGEIAEAAERFRRDHCPRMSAAAAEVRPMLDEIYHRAIETDLDVGRWPRTGLPPRLASTKETLPC